MEASSFKVISSSQTQKSGVNNEPRAVKFTLIFQAQGDRLKRWLLLQQPTHVKIDTKCYG